jgi:RNA polymerase sigma factor (sigma-70 family)
MENRPVENEARACDSEELYREYYSFLYTVAITRFSIPFEDATGLVHDVLLSYLRIRETIRSRRTWLLSAICNACRGYWTRRGEREDLTDSLDSGRGVGEPFDDDSDRIASRLTALRVLGRLSTKDRELLRLHYLEGHTSVEIARRLNLSSGAVRKRLHDGLVRATREYRRLEAGNA